MDHQILLVKGIAIPDLKNAFLGTWICQNQKLPSNEVCDGIDNDCNGKVDDLGDTAIYDIVVAIDDSLSMNSIINNVQNAINNFASVYSGSSNFKFALVRFTDIYQDNTVLLKLNFSNASVFNTAVMGMSSSNGGGNEASLDTPYVVADPNNLLGLSWRTGSKRVLIEFTDEEAQTYLNPPVTQLMAADAVVAAGIKTYIFNHPLLWLQFENITNKSGGKMFDISEDYAHILNNLNTVLQGVCK